MTSLCAANSTTTDFARAAAGSLSAFSIRRASSTAPLTQSGTRDATLRRRSPQAAPFPLWCRAVQFHGHLCRDGGMLHSLPVNEIIQFVKRHAGSCARARRFACLGRAARHAAAAETIRTSRKPCLTCARVSCGSTCREICAVLVRRVACASRRRRVHRGRHAWASAQRRAAQL